MVTRIPQAGTGMRGFSARFSERERKLERKLAQSGCTFFPQPGQLNCSMCHLLHESLRFPAGRVLFLLNIFIFSIRSGANPSAGECHSADNSSFLQCPFWPFSLFDQWFQFLVKYLQIHLQSGSWGSSKSEPGCSSSNSTFKCLHTKTVSLKQDQVTCRPLVPKFQHKRQRKKHKLPYLRSEGSCHQGTLQRATPIRPENVP